MAFTKALTYTVQQRQKQTRFKFMVSSVAVGVVGLANLITAIILSHCYIHMGVDQTGVLAMGTAGVLLIVFSIVSNLSLEANRISFKWYIPLALCVAGLAVTMATFNFVDVAAVKKFKDDLRNGNRLNRFGFRMKSHLLEMAESGECKAGKTDFGIHTITCDVTGVNEYIQALTVQGGSVLHGPCYNSHKDLTPLEVTSTSAVVVCKAGEKLAERLSLMLILTGISTLNCALVVLFHAGFAVWLNVRRRATSRPPLPK